MSQNWNAESVAALLLRAATERTARSPITAEWDGLTEEVAYKAQDIALQTRIDRGERLVGVKLGVTSRAKQKQVGVETPNVAWLTDAMALPVGEPVPYETLIHPRIEPEIAFLLGRDLEGPGVGPAEALAAVDLVFGAVEIIDSRFSGYAFTAVDATADNASSGRYILGTTGIRPDAIDLWLESCLLEVGGDIVDSATGAAVYGSPAEALTFAANTLGERGHTLKAGWLVLTGGMTDAVPLTPGMSASAQFGHLGTVSLWVAPHEVT